ncbi:peptide methionine sulfoxide reductase MsrA [Blastomonas marina]|uniref:Peptide methionine sulfoxide reductase MsrA n=1 Tax=Blastomonas marina TaxID=1867408 RepID=A0ABQ1F2P2_9SPHN|nr:peptide-methionine (S)-S-oxide reductase MsrA [Blastomonas marina]GFZ97098.1 peptide methionine sulfoxide reductase MsrA [Blastomonas marina]
MERGPGLHRLAAAALASLALAACQSPPENPIAPTAERVADEAAGLQTALLAGGCFWGIEGIYSHTKGVTGAVTGYHGGSAETATYKQSNTGTTGHAETVRITYDPAQIRYDEILRIFFTVGIDPTQANGQGPDIGDQYRAAIIPLNEEQRAVATSFVRQMDASGNWSEPIAVKIEDHMQFYPAEAEHQDWIPRNPLIARAKAKEIEMIDKLEAKFPSFYRDDFLRDFEG